MRDALIIVCDKKVVVFGQELYQASSFLIDDLAKAVGTDQFEVREALLVLGGELDGPHPLDREVIQQVLQDIKSCRHHYDEDEETSLEKAAKEALSHKQEVFCSFSLC